MNIEYRAFTILAFSALLLSGCAASRGDEEMAGHVGSEHQVTIPARSTAWVKEGTFPNVEDLRTVRVGMSKHQLYALIGKPHFSEGLFGPKQWDYIFKFRTKDGAEIMTCQYQIHFDKNSHLDATYWDSSACRDLLAPGAPVIAAAPPLAQ